MIDKNLPEPQPEYRTCCTCSKNTRLTGTLIHWPNENCTKSEVTLINGHKIESFSMWIYKCAWCKAIDTKRKKKYELAGE